MTPHQVAGRGQWVQARKALLAREKEFTRERDALSEARRQMPWLRIDKKYSFDTARGKQTLAELFGGRHQLIVQHFMFDPDWENPCKSCSFWADNFNLITPHLQQRDANFVAISRAPLAKLQAIAKRLGWGFNWVSSFGNDFNHDFHVSTTEAERAAGEAEYNYAPMKTKMTELPGISVFYRDDDGAIYHTYSCYARGLDMLNGAYHYMDLLPKGRDENGSHPMAWVKLRDQYAA